MSANETKVDVLAVLDDAFTFCAGQNSGPTENEMRQARTAVAELIEAATNASATLCHAYHTTLTGQLADHAHEGYQRLDAVLARIGGAA